MDLEQDMVYREDMEIDLGTDGWWGNRELKGMAWVKHRLVWPDQKMVALGQAAPVVIIDLEDDSYRLG